MLVDMLLQENFWKVVVNPESFTQTIENMFYFSFLIKDGHAKFLKAADDSLSAGVLCGNFKWVEIVKKFNFWL